MSISKKARDYHEKMFPDYKSKLLETDLEFIELFDNFAFDEVISNGSIDDKTRMISILASLIGCQGFDEFKAMIKAAVNLNVTLIEIKEIVYQAVAYLGIGRVFPFIHAVNDYCIQHHIPLPLEAQSTTNALNRLKEGREAQIDIFGESMKDFYKSGDNNIKHINYWLTDNCFGDYYTRKGLNYRQRELITFCFLLSQGGCEPQLKGHIKANIRVGNDINYLIEIVSQLIPFIGYPRSLNAISCLKEIEKEEK